MFTPKDIMATIFDLLVTPKGHFLRGEMMQLDHPDTSK